MDVLTTLILFNTAVLLVNAITAGLCLYYYRDRLYRLSLCLWLMGFANSFLQGLLQKTPLQMILGFSTYFVCSLLLVRILDVVTGLRFPVRRYYAVMAAGLAASLGLLSADMAFRWAAMPTAIGIAYPMIDAALRAFCAPRSKVEGFSRIYSGVLLVNGLHFLDYPFLRTSDSYALLGFSFALVVLVALSLVLPAFITKNISDRYAGALEEEVRARTCDLIESNANLKKMTNENKYLLSVVCHDIASPLATVAMGIDLVHDPDEEDSLDPEQRKMMARVRKSLSTIEEILSYVKTLQAAREGKARFELAAVDLAEVFEESSSVVAENLARKNLVLKIENEVAGKKALADIPTLKNQVLNNLLTNAIKFSHPGGEIRVLIRESGDRLALSISDSGIGMPKQIAEQIFSPKVATNRLGTAGEKGTGFGLPIVKACLDQYGAEIHCESRSQAEYPEGHGTEFTIHFKKVPERPRSSSPQSFTAA